MTMAARYPVNEFITIDMVDETRSPERNVPRSSSPMLRPPDLDRISALERGEGDIFRRHPLTCLYPDQDMSATNPSAPQLPVVLARRQFMKPARYDGTGSLESFLRQFEVCANHNQWTSKEKTDFLQCSLEKSAVQLLWDFGSRTDVTYEDLTERLRQRYGLESQAETFRTQLRCRRQGEKESLASLLHDVRRLVTLAYPVPASELTEAIARDAFLDAMFDVELSLKVRE